MKKIFSVLLVMFIFIFYACSPHAEQPNYRSYNVIDSSGVEFVNTEKNFEINKSVAEDKSKFILSPLCADGAVFQRNRVSRFFGSYLGDENQLALEISGIICYTEKDNLNNFIFYIPPQAAAKGITVTIFTSSCKYTVKDISFGEVFLLSGQSNMEMPMAEDAEYISDRIDYSKLEDIRLFYTPPSKSAYEETELISTLKWEKLTKNTLERFSFVGFYFGKVISEEYGVPVGLVMAAMGNTVINSWIPSSEYENMETLLKAVNISAPDYVQNVCYNSMINPLKDFIFRGTVWYQGENQPNRYDELLKHMIYGWRNEFRDTNHKFVLVQLPKYGSDSARWGYWFTSRELQKKVAIETDGVTYSVNIDRGDIDNIHPADKNEVGRRAAYAFMKEFFAAEGILRGPELTEAQIVGDKIELRLSQKFDIQNSGVGFEVGQGNKFYEVYAYKEDNKIILPLPSGITSPKSVRYGFKAIYGINSDNRDMSKTVSVFNLKGFPLEQFNFVFT